jgi:hypothetical protein
MIAFMRTEVCEAPFQLVEHACIHADERKKRGQHNETSKYTSQRTIKGRGQKKYIQERKIHMKIDKCGIIQTGLLQDTKI